MIYQNMLVSLYHLTTFTFTQLPDWFLTLSWHCVRQRLQKGKVLTTLIFCLLESLIYLPISLSLLETGQRNSRFLFLLSKLEKGIQVSLSPLETRQENSRFLFLSSRRGKGIWISLSLLEIGERDSHFSFSSQMWRNCFNFSFFFNDCGAWDSEVPLSIVTRWFLQPLVLVVGWLANKC